MSEVITAPISRNEAVRLRELLQKNDEGVKLSADEEEELRGYVTRYKPDKAKTADYTDLILLGLMLLGLCVVVYVALAPSQPAK